MTPTIQPFYSGAYQKTSKTFLIHSAFTQQPMAEVQTCDLLHAVAAIQSAQKALSFSADWSLEKRIEVLNLCIERLKKYEMQMAQDESQQQGLSLNNALNYSIRAAQSSFVRACDEVKALDAEKQRLSPTGLISIIAPGLLSLRAICERWAPALAAGNPVVIKASRRSPLSAHWLTQIAQEIGLPSGAINVVYGAGDEVGEILCAHPSIKGVTFAGSLRVAEKMIKVSSAQFKKVQISTTQKNFAVVLSDADLDQAVQEILRGSLLARGQTPFSIHRVFIVESVASAFIEKFKNLLAQTNVTDEVCILTPDQSLQKLQDMAVEAHAKILYAGSGSDSIQDKKFQTLFTMDMTNCSTIQQDDLQAPLVILTTVKYQHEVQKYANVGYYGSDAFLFGSREKCEKVMSQLTARQYFFNTFEVPVGPVLGFKQSFYGDPNFSVTGRFYSDTKQVQNFDTPEVLSKN